MRLYLLLIALILYSVWFLDCDDPIAFSDKKITILLSDTTITIGDTVTFNGSETSELLQGIELSYRWTVTPVAYLSDSTGSSVRFCTNKAGEYEILVTVFGAGVESALGKAFVTVGPKPPLVAAIRLNDTTLSYEDQLFIRSVLCRHDTLIITHYDTTKDTMRIHDTSTIACTVTVHDTVKICGSAGDVNPDSLLTYHWVAIDSGLIISNPDDSIARISVRTEGVYGLRLVVSNSRGTRDSTTVYLRFVLPAANALPVPKIRNSDTTVYCNDTLILRAESISDTTSYQNIWNLSDSSGLLEKAGQVLKLQPRTIGAISVNIALTNGADTVWGKGIVVSVINYAQAFIESDSLRTIETYKQVVFNATKSVSYRASQPRIVWRLPDGGELSNDTGLTTQFMVQTAGIYRIIAEINDGVAAGIPDTVLIFAVHPGDTIAPSNISNLHFTQRNFSSVNLTWTKSLSEDAYLVQIRECAEDGYSLDINQGTVAANVSSAETSCVVSNLEQKRMHRFSAFVLDSSGRWSSYSLAAQCSVWIKDTIMPSPVRNLTTVGNSNDSIVLRWQPSLSTDVATIMVLFRTEQNPADTSNGKLLLRGSQKDTLLKALLPGKDTAAFFSVYAVDSSGLYSPAVTLAFTRLFSVEHETLTVTPSTSARPSSVLGFDAEASGNSRIQFSWSRIGLPDSGSVIIRYRTDSVYPASCTDGMLVDEMKVSDSIFIWKDCRQQVPYRFSIFVKNTAGMCGFDSAESRDTLMLPDTIPPENISGLIGRYNRQSQQINLHWIPSTSGDADSIAICMLTNGVFPVSHNDGRITSVLNSDSTFNLPVIASVPERYITIFVRDTNANWNLYGQSIMVSLLSDTLLSDTIPPSGPRNFSINISPDSTAIEYSWMRSDSADADSIFVRYFMNGSAPKSPTEGMLAWADTIQQSVSLVMQKALIIHHEKSLYAFSAFIKDRAGNWSLAISDTVRTTDRTRPENIRGLKCKVISASSIRIEWQPSPSNDCDSLRLCIRTDRFSADNNDWTMCRSRNCGTVSVDTIQGLTEKNIYFISAFVCDSARNWSFSDAASQDSIRIADFTSPQPISNFEALPLSNNEIIVRWAAYTGSTDADSVVIALSIGNTIPTLGNGSSICARLGRSNLSDTIRGLLEKTRYTFSGFVRDSSGNWSTGVSASATTFDETTPLNVSGFDARNAGVNSAILSWQSSGSLDVDSIILCQQIGGYAITPTSGTTIARLSANEASFTAINLTEKIRYWFSAFVKDSSGNISNFSQYAVDSITIRDATPPPGVMSFVATGGAGGKIRFSWSANPSWVDAESIYIVIRYNQYPINQYDGIRIIRTATSTTRDSVSGMEEKRIYFCKAFVMDTSKNFNISSAQDTSWVPDWTSPQNVTGFSIAANNGTTTTTISWIGSSSTDAESTLIAFETDGTFPLSSTDGTICARVATLTNSVTINSLLSGSEYRFAAFVKDSAGLWSTPSAQARTVLDRLSVANAGRDTSIFLLSGNTLMLDGGQSYDPDGKTLSYRWESSETNPAAITISQIRNPTLTFVQPGQYVFILTVSDGIYNSTPDQIRVTFMAPRIIVSGSMQPGNGYKLFRSIQTAVDSSVSGDTIVVDNGAYAENVRCLMKTNLTIMGMSRTRVIVDGNAHTPYGSTFTVDSASNGIIIKNMTFKNGGRTDPSNIDVAGITCFHARNVVLENDSVVSNYGDGIRLFMSSSISIIGCAVMNNAYSGVKGTSSSFTLQASMVLNNGRSGSTDAWGLFLDCETDLAQTVTISGNNEFSNAGLTQISINDTDFNGAQYNLSITGNLFLSGTNGIICTGGPVISPNPLTNNVFTGITGTLVNCQ